MSGIPDIPPHKRLVTRRGERYLDEVRSKTMKNTRGPARRLTSKARLSFYVPENRLKTTADNY